MANFLTRLFGSTPRQDSGPPTVNLARADGWENTSTGLGLASRDKAVQGYFQPVLRLDDIQLQSMYNGDDLAAKIIEGRPKEMFRAGYDVTIEGAGGDEEDTSDDRIEALEKKAREISLDDRLLEGMIWGRLWGGALVMIGADDGGAPNLPLREDKIQAVRWLNVVDRRFVQVQKFYDNPLAPNYGKPEIYSITNLTGGTVSYVHETRCLRFEGAPTDIVARRQFYGWTFSVLQRPYESIRQFGQTYQAVAHLLTDASQGVFKMSGLLQAIAQDAGALQTRMALVDMSRSVMRAVMLDADTGEDFSRVATSFSGIPDVIDRFMQRVASAAEMPVSILFGRSPAGMNATGESDFRMWYDTIAAEQVKILKPQLLRIYRLMAASKELGLGTLDFDLEFQPLWEATAAEMATMRYTVAQADSLYTASGVLLPEEVALSRFGTGAWNPNTKIDVSAREKALVHELDLMADPEAKQAAEAAQASAMTAATAPKQEDPPAKIQEKDAPPQAK